MRGLVPEVVDSQVLFGERLEGVEQVQALVAGMSLEQARQQVAAVAAVRAELRDVARHSRAHDLGDRLGQVQVVAQAAFLLEAGQRLLVDAVDREGLGQSGGYEEGVRILVEPLEAGLGGVQAHHVLEGHFGQGWIESGGAPSFGDPAHLGGAAEHRYQVLAAGMAGQAGRGLLLERNAAPLEPAQQAGSQRLLLPAHQHPGCAAAGAVHQPLGALGQGLGTVLRSGGAVPAHPRRHRLAAKARVYNLAQGAAAQVPRQLG